MSANIRGSSHETGYISVKQGYKIIDKPRCCYIDGIWNQEDPEKWLSIIQVPVEKNE